MYNGLTYEIWGVVMRKMEIMWVLLGFLQWRKCVMKSECSSCVCVLIFVYFFEFL